jgi:hypothetical protein
MAAILYKIVVVFCAFVGPPGESRRLTDNYIPTANKQAIFLHHSVAGCDFDFLVVTHFDFTLRALGLQGL